MDVTTSWQQDSREKGIGEKVAATVSNPISRARLGKRQSGHPSVLRRLPLREPRQLRGRPRAPLPSRASAGLPGSLSLLHYGRMLQPQSRRR